MVAVNSTGGVIGYQKFVLKFDACPKNSLETKFKPVKFEYFVGLMYKP